MPSRCSMNANERKRDRQTDREKDRQGERINSGIRQMIDTSYQIKVGGGSIVNTISTPLWTPFLPFGDWSQWWTREPCWPFFLSTVQIDLVYANKHRSQTKFIYMHLLMGKTVLHKKSLVHSINFLNPIKSNIDRFSGTYIKMTSQ